MRAGCPGAGAAQPGRPRAHRWAATAACAALTAVACSDDLAPAGKADGGGGAPVSSHAAGDVTETVVNASSADAWIYLDLESGAAVTVPDPASSRDWDLGFQRFKVKSNGGMSGTAGTEVALVPGAALAEVTRAPSSGWVVDRPDGDDQSMDPDFAFNVGDGWYSYDPATHALSARKQTYVVMTGNGGFFAVQMLKYYDDAGTSGFIRFLWKRVGAPEGTRIPAVRWVAVDGGADGGGDGGAADGGAIDAADADAGAPPGSFEVPATAAMAWVYLTASGEKVTPADPATSHEWDLAFSRTLVRTNSGTSGPGMGGARLGDPGAAFDQTSAAPADGYEPDRMLPTPGPPGAGEHSGNPVLEGWYDYDPATHQTKPKAIVFLVRTASGGHAKLQVLSYEGGTYRIRLGTLP